jgi:rare lipoprotein A
MAALLSIGVLWGCAGVRVEPRPSAAPAGDGASAVAGPAELGLASWYGEFHHGRQTASGEVFDMTQLTAAHRTLPLGTRLRVTNLENGRIVRVRVNDRGPYVAGRILDLSHQAARHLDMVERGVVPVRLDIVGP